MTTETQTTIPKYQVVPNQCSCHPETCCCDDWAIFENGSKKTTMHRKEDADEYAATLNKSTTYPEQAVPTDFSDYISNAPFFHHNLICKVIYDDAAYNSLPPESKCVVDAVKQLLEINTVKITGLFDRVSFTGNATIPPQYHRSGSPTHIVFPNIVQYSSIPKLLNAWHTLDMSLNVIYVEPDATATVVVRFWYFDGVKPSGFHTNNAERDICKKEREPAKFVISFSGILDESEDTKIAQTVLDDLNRAAINPFK